MDRLFERSRFTPVARQFDGELGPALRPIDGVDLAAEVLHDAVGNGEPKPETLAQRLGGEERIEESLSLVRRYAVAVVRNGDGDGVTDCADPDPDPGLVLAGDGIER